MEIIKSRNTKYECLIFIGSSATFIYSIFSWIIFGESTETHNYLFFETSATIITLVLLGNVLENKSVQKKQQQQLTILSNTKSHR